MRAGYYAIIQYCSVPGSGEAINVGVVLVSPPLGALRVRMSETNARVQRSLTKAGFDDARLVRDKLALEHRLANAGISSLEDLREFISLEAGHLSFTAPRSIAVSDDLEEEIEALFERFASDNIRRQPRVRAPDIRPVFDALAMRVPIYTHQRVELPNMGSFVAPYAYRNAAIHYIRPVGFSPNPLTALQSASLFATQGRVLRRHPDEEGNERDLIVVASFGSETIKMRVSGVFADCGVRMVPQEELSAFADEVESHAHN